jgi:hypothetical protein
MEPCIRRLRRGGDGAPGKTPLHPHALAIMGRRQGGEGARMLRYRRRRRSNLRPACALERPGMSPVCVQCALIALFVDLQLHLGLFGVTCVAACLGIRWKVRNEEVRSDVRKADGSDAIA